MRIKTKKNIAVIGGGIAGLTFAHCLGSDGYDIEIFEQKPFFGEAGAAISVFPNALCVMEEIGLLDQILSAGGHFQQVYIRNSKGKKLSHSTPKSDYPVICIHRADLHGILLTGIPATLSPGFELQDFRETKNGQIEVQFTNGESRLVDGLVGADGLHSQVRRHIINDGAPIYRGYNIWRGVVDTTFATGYASETMGNGQRVGIVPIKDGKYGWWATCNESFLQKDDPEGTKEKLLRLFGDWHDPIPELIRNTATILKNGALDRLPMRGWSKGNITLLGDAAHPTTPNLGQGGCIAIEGSYVLAKTLLKYGLGAEAFQRYEGLQFPRAKTVVSESLQLGKIGQLNHPFSVALRNLGFQAVPSSLAIKMVDKYFSYRVTKLSI